MSAINQLIEVESYRRALDDLLEYRYAMKRNWKRNIESNGYTLHELLDSAAKWQRTKQVNLFASDEEITECVEQVMKSMRDVELLIIPKLSDPSGLSESEMKEWDDLVESTETVQMICMQLKMFYLFGGILL